MKSCAAAVQQVLLHGVPIHTLNSETRTVAPCCSYVTLVAMVMWGKADFGSV